MTTKYTIDPAHSAASFSIKHMMIAKVHGGFEKLGGTLNYDPSAPEKSAVDVQIEMNSISTREAARDTHLKSADFFDVEKFPKITFKSTSVSKNADNRLAVNGDLTIKDQTRQVVLAVDEISGEMKDPWGNIKIGASASTKIKRKDFGLTWNAALEAGGVLVGDDVTINLEMQFTKST